MLPTTTGAAQPMVLTCVCLAGGVTVISRLSQGQHVQLREGVGVAFSAVALSALAEFEPQIAASLALLLLGTATFVYGGPAFAGISRAAGGAKTNPPSSGTGAGGGTVSA